ncbi:MULTISPECIES: cysteine hydrolase [Frankia]|uniref:Isochorismatase hydrolase n=1 Tax=Frankia alni (strain DSM 45986 / CECT 9034 / ACN14a) TaxID=326424 RepID=Q0RL19_FRAAA|nr:MULTISPECIES: cysteine hydrolase [Frankia]CAJ61786.1 putative Isochorismatase hydrolase [Frankia alni ACN14a]
MVHGLDRGERAALVVSECLRGTLDPELAIFAGLAEQAAARGILARIAALAADFRTLELPVVHIHVAHRPDFGAFSDTNPVSAKVRRERRVLAGTPQAEPMPQVAPQPGDYVSTRRSGLAMWYGTDLDSTLRNLRVDTVVLTGVSTNMALLAGALGATDRGYRSVLVEDATAGASAESHAWIVANQLRMLSTIARADEIHADLTRRDAATTTPPRH